MNLILLTPEDFIADHLVRLSGRRFEHVTTVHRAAVGDELLVGLIGDRMGSGRVAEIQPDALTLEVRLERDPPPPLPLTLILALPRPKVLNRLVASVASLGVKRLILINAWRVERSFWKSPRLAPENLRAQLMLGLEQGRDTILPEISFYRFFTGLAGDLPAMADRSTGLVAHPTGETECPRKPDGPIVLAVGPEGGFIPEEIETFEQAGFTTVGLGPRALRVETFVPFVLGRLF